MNERIPILVIDDEECVRLALEYNLKLEWFDAYFAEDGASGLELARSKRPSLILLDWMMPGMDGLEVLCELKHDKRTKDIPVIMLTAKGKVADIDRAFELGAYDYVTKPFKGEQLVKTLKEKLAGLKKPKKRGLKIFSFGKS